MRLYLLRYDRHRGELLSIDEFGGQDFEAANQALLAAERADPDLEVVLLQAESKGQLRTTHGRYFGDFKGMGEFAASR